MAPPMIRSYRSWQTRTSKARTEADKPAWRDELLEAARLLDHLDVRDIETFVLQRSVLARELRRLARRAVAHT